jgi:hypothetical protein
MDQSWEQRLAKRYYDKLFKEYVLTSLSSLIICCVRRFCLVFSLLVAVQKPKELQS